MAFPFDLKQREKKKKPPEGGFGEVLTKLNAQPLLLWNESGLEPRV